MKSAPDYSGNSPFASTATSGDVSGWKEALARVDAQDILDHYNAENITVDESRGEIIHSCLIDRVDPHHSHGDASPGASINMKSMLYNCFSYGGGNLFWFLEKMEGSVQKGIEALGGLIRDSFEDQGKLMDKLRQLLVVEEKTISIPSYSPRILKAWEGLLHPYMTDERGFSEEVLDRYRVGFDPKDNRVIMPHFYQEKLVGWQKRALPYDSLNRWPRTELTDKEIEDNVKAVQKYKNTPSFPKTETLFNYDEAVKHPESVIVTEGALRVYRAEGFEDRVNVVSNFSAKLSKEQAQLLSPFGKVYVMYDDDFAGWRGSYWALIRLAKLTNAYWIPPVKDKDLADMDRDGVESALSSALPSPLALAKIKQKLGD